MVARACARRSWSQAPSRMRRRAVERAVGRSGERDSKPGNRCRGEHGSVIELATGRSRRGPDRSSSTQPLFDLRREILIPELRQSLRSAKLALRVGARDQLALELKWSEELRRLA
jgi:hypothetical protein